MQNWTGIRRGCIPTSKVSVERNCYGPVPLSFAKQIQLQLLSRHVIIFQFLTLSFAIKWYRFNPTEVFDMVSEIAGWPMLLLDCIQFQVCALIYLLIIMNWLIKIMVRLPKWKWILKIGDRSWHPVYIISLQIGCNVEPQSMLSFTSGSEVDEEGFPNEIKLYLYIIRRILVFFEYFNFSRRTSCPCILMIVCDCKLWAQKQIPQLASHLCH